MAHNVDHRQTLVASAATRFAGHIRGCERCDTGPNGFITKESVVKKTMTDAKDLKSARELSLNQLDQVAGGGFAFYIQPIWVLGGTGVGYKPGQPPPITWP